MVKDLDAVLNTEYLLDRLKQSYTHMGKATLVSPHTNEAYTTRDGLAIIEAVERQESKHNISVRDCLKHARKTESMCGDGTTTSSLGYLAAINSRFNFDQDLEEDAFIEMDALINKIAFQTKQPLKYTIHNYVDTVCGKSFSKQDIKLIAETLHEYTVEKEMFTIVSSEFFKDGDNRTIGVTKNSGISFKAWYPESLNSLTSNLKSNQCVVTTSREYITLEKYKLIENFHANLMHNGLIRNSTICLLIGINIAPELNDYLSTLNNVSIIPCSLINVDASDAVEYIKTLETLFGVDPTKTADTYEISSKIAEFLVNEDSEAVKNCIIKLRSIFNIDKEGFKEKNFTLSSLIDSDSSVMEKIDAINTKMSNEHAETKMSNERAQIEKRNILDNLVRDHVTHILRTEVCEEAVKLNIFTQVGSIDLKHNVVNVSGLFKQDKNKVEELRELNLKRLKKATNSGKEEVLYNTIDKLIRSCSCAMINVNKNKGALIYKESEDALKDVVHSLECLVTSDIPRKKWFVRGGMHAMNRLINLTRWSKNRLVVSIGIILEEVVDIFMQNAYKTKLKVSVLDSVLVVKRTVYLIIEGLKLRHSLGKHAIIEEVNL